MPAASQAELQFVDIADFSPGVWSDFYAARGAQSAPPGAAQINGTYGCVAPSKTSGLLPGPRLVNTMLETFVGSAPDDAANHITAFRALSPVSDRTGISSGSAVGNIRPFPDQLFIAFEWYNGGKHNQKIRTYKMYKQLVANPGLGSVGTYDICSTAVGSVVAGANTAYGFAGIDLTRTNPSDPTSPGYVIAACGLSSNKDFTQQAHVAYPSTTTPTTDSVQTMTGLEVSGGFSCYAMFCHQNRVFSLNLSVNYGFALGGEVPFDGVIGTAPNDITTNGVGLSTFVSENPGGFGSWCTMNASEAFFVKQSNGGFSLRGDVSFPTVVALPGLEPTGNAINIGTIDNNGIYVYGTIQGVYGWSGGDTSPHMSPQLDGWFWKVPGANGVDQYLFAKGSFRRVRNYVFAPNNFFMVSDTGGWWRLGFPTDQGGSTPLYIFNEISGAGYLIASPSYISGGQQVVADWYDINQGRPTYQWVSHPLPTTKDREVAWRSIALTAMGSGTVQVTIAGIDGSTVTESFAINSPTKPVTIQLQTEARSYDTFVTINSAATDTTNGTAPRVFRLRLGYHELETARGG